MNPLSLPDDLRPADGRFGSGPSKVRPDALAALAAAGSGYLGTSHRRDGVRSVVRRIRDGIATLYGLPDGYEVLLGNGGATAFWDAAAFRLIERRSLHYSFGEFSSKFAAVAAGAPFLDDPVVVDAPPGTHPDPVADDSVDAAALTHNETSTGVSMPVERPAGSALVLVDGTSAAGVIPVDPAAFDAYYFSPQKAFGSDGGLWVAMCSPAALERIASLERWTPRFLDLRAAVEQSRKDQTLNTPALATLFLLADQLDWLLSQGGLAWSAERGRRAAGLVYGWAEASSFAEPFVADPAMRSTTVATVDLEAAVPAADLTGALRANGIVDVEAYRGLARNQVRIGLWPAVDLDDLERLLAAVDWLAERLGG
jgi:phosphoserine aminotransferase